MAVKYFQTQKDWRAWLTQNHLSAKEFSVGFYKKSTGKPSITYPQAVDESLCFGWIDGVRHRINAESYRVRFTPRKARSIWSQVNIKRVIELKAAGAMRAAGLAAFESRDAKKAGRYSSEH